MKNEPIEKITKIALSMLQNKLIRNEKNSNSEIFLFFSFKICENKIIVIKEGKNLKTDDDGINIAPARFE